MRVKCIVLDGFKSYAHRQELADLDKHFNAITGFNGSGKSNVFDAICFVMGISNLKKVRAEDTRDLIYRGGLGGVVKAHVTIEFINDDPKTAPAGYPPSEYPIITVGRQTQVGGKQRYFFLNRQSDAAKIKHFFQNINLNVDNPHFMVLQGTVHKLIGMKSADILALVEEAVGTKVFDVRRRTAETLIRSKEKRLQEINHNLTHEIGPMLEAMKADQDEYGQFLNLQESLETKRQFRAALTFWNASQALKQANDERLNAERELQQSKQSLAGIPALVEAQERTVRELEQQLREPEGAYAKLHEEEAEVRKDMSRLEISLQASEKSLSELLKQQKAHVAEVAELEKLKVQHATLTQQRLALKESIQQRTAAIQAIKDSLALTRNGVVAGSSGKSVEEERQELEAALIRTQGALRRTQERSEELAVNIRKLQDNIKSGLQKSQQAQAQLEQAKKRVATAAEKYRPYETVEQRLKEVTAELNDANRRLLVLQSELNASAGGEAAAQSLQVAFHFTPVPSAPDLASKIYGRLGQLLRPKDHKYSLALSIGAQQHLLKVVVDTDATAQIIVEQGSLRQRTSFLPVNQVRPPRIDPKKIEDAQRRALSCGGFATVASELVVCEDARAADVVRAMFSGFLVCSDLTLATAIAFEVGLKAVTLDGQTADPQGLMSGGAITDAMDLISRIHAESQRLQPLQQLQQRVRALETETTRLHTEIGKGGSIRAELEEAEDAQQRAELQLRSVGGSSAEQLSIMEQENATVLSRTIPNLTAEEAAIRVRLEEVQKLSSLDKTALIQKLEQELKQETKRLEGLKKQYDDGAPSYDKLDATIEQRENDLRVRTDDMEREVSQQKAHRDQIEESKQRSSAKIDAIRLKRAECDAQRKAVERDLQEAEAGRQSLRDRHDGLERKVKEIDQQLKAIGRSVEEQKRSVSECERRHPWVRDEQHAFGDVNGPFYFLDEARTAQTMREIHEAESLAEKLSKKVNKKSTVMYESIKKEYDELVEKRATLDEDRQAILEVIDRVEARKWDSLDRMVVTVSDTFSMLFSACLPGAACRLVEERNDHGHISGLQVRVAFNGKEKESLTELSGGQRSLLALCLILAILRLKPAPIYILDEVDAALDPSHTQNIGRMLQQHFSNSQFLLVSLKDGMFSHANVLFEVRNTQGFSEITRKEAKK